MPDERFVFVDRDGTLVEDPGFVHRIEDYAPLAGAADGLRLLVEAGYRIAIVTNQSGIGRGIFSAAQYEAFDAHCAATSKHGARRSRPASTVHTLRKTAAAAASPPRACANSETTWFKLDVRLVI